MNRRAGSIPSKARMSAVNAAGARLAVDIGGTFTDIVLEARNRRWTGKVLTTPRAPEEAVIGAVQEILAQAGFAAVTRASSYSARRSLPTR